MPLPTLGCTLDATGIRAPSYAEILASLQDSARSIFGADVYLEPDSQDGQLLGIFTQAIVDVNNQTIATYRSYSPTYAQGAGLASLVKINGLTVPAATRSTVVVTLAGVVGTTITNGAVQDVLGNVWSLPNEVVIGISGATTVTATAQQPGAIIAPIGTVTGVYTPTFGWQSVTNPAPSVPGTPVPSDAQIRRAQRDAVALPSQSIDAGILAAVRNVPGVAQAYLYENESNVTDANGLTPHSIAVVVQGGSAQAIVDAIGSRKTPGTTTIGSVTGTYRDDSVGLAGPIRYYPLNQVQLRIEIQLSPQIGYSSVSNALITNAVVAYVNSLGIGNDVYLSKLYAPANLSGEAATTTSGLNQQQLDAISATYVITSLAIGPVDGTAVPANFVIGFTSAAALTASNVSITIV